MRPGLDGSEEHLPGNSQPDCIYETTAQAVSYHVSNPGILGWVACHIHKPCPGASRVIDSRVCVISRGGIVCAEAIPIIDIAMSAGQARPFRESGLHGIQISTDWHSKITGDQLDIGYE